MNILKNIILIILLLFMTVGIVITKPSVHKPAVVEDASFTLQSLEKKKPAVVKSDFETTLPPAQKTVVEKPAPVVKRIVKVIRQEVEVPQTQTTVKVSEPKPVQKTVQTIPQQEVQTQKPVKIVEVPKPVETVETEAPVNLELEQKQPVKIVTTPVKTTPLTEKEEIIAWNKWRSDLQNKVMRDSKINAPLGTTFYFSCTVDKFGNISNINTWSDNDYYTPLAKRVIKPVLSSYQNQPILKFPERTQRTITNVNGSFTMAYTDRYSTPADYSDYERIR